MYTALCTFILTLIFAINVREKIRKSQGTKNRLLHCEPTLMKYSYFLSAGPNL